MYWKRQKNAEVAETVGTIYNGTYSSSKEIAVTLAMALVAVMAAV